MGNTLSSLEKYSLSPGVIDDKSGLMSEYIVKARFTLSITSSGLSPWLVNSNNAARLKALSDPFIIILSRGDKFHHHTISLSVTPSDFAHLICSSSPGISEAELKFQPGGH